MTLAYAICGLIILFIAGYALWQYLAIQRANAVGQPLAHAAIRYEQHPANPTLHFIVLGDSTAVGVGAGDPRLSTAGRLGTEFPQADITNLGVSGEETTGLAAQLQTLPDAHYDLALIQIGANDAVYFAPLSQTRTAIPTILTWAATHASSTIILSSGQIGLSPVFHFPLAQIMTARAKNVRALFLKDVAGYPSITYVDLLANTAVNDLFLEQPTTYYAADFFHPSAAGYAAWYGAIQEALPATLRSAQ